ncbi:AMP-binding protein [Aquibacillus kalidii]|uniref:AMP-binding protein n=1 Tax=Aquibacillus kalidii TaxID=2762597 RepID=UPI001646CF04|nr:AMP-binding protein [Aquibacillus kalidii]
MKDKVERPWLAHYPANIPWNMEYEQKSLHAILKETALKSPRMKALHFKGKELTYEQVYFQSNQLAAHLQANGLQKGDRVSVMLPNTPQAVISYYAVLMAGGIVVQTNPLYKERELEYQLKDSGSTMIICLDLLYPLVEKVKSKTSISHVIVTQIKDYLPFPKNLIHSYIQKKQQGSVVTVKESDTTYLWTSIMKQHHPDLVHPLINPTEDLALLQYTGGTTGYPKGVMLTHYNLVANVQMCEVWIHKKSDKQNIVLGVLPFFHVYGMTTVMNYAVLTGSKIVLLPKFEVEDVLRTIEKQRPNVFPGAPTIYIGLLNHPKLNQYDLTSIETCISGSAPLPLEIQEQFEKVTGGRLIEGYGLSESSPVTHANLIAPDAIQGGIGLPWPDTIAKIVSLETLEEADVGEVGEIAVQGPQVMKGYWNREEETEQVLRDGWLYTGDIGYMDEAGRFYVIDRKKDVIIAGGYNIYPREVEDVLYEHEGIQELVVVGIPDMYRGETVKAFVVLKDGVNIDEKTLDAFCRKRMASYKVPRIYEFRSELPKTAVGKILRRKLIDEERQKINSREDQSV